jgi:hypothetical protein
MYIPVSPPLLNINIYMWRLISKTCGLLLQAARVSVCPLDDVRAAVNNVDCTCTNTIVQSSTEELPSAEERQEPQYGVGRRSNMDIIKMSCLLPASCY